MGITTRDFWRGAVTDLLLLSLAAGSADAVGYMALGQVFTCNMTGNVVLCGLLFGRGESLHAFRFLFVLVLFALGVAFGLWTSDRLDPKHWPSIVARILRLETALLVLFAFG